MKTLKITNSLLCLIVFLKTFASTSVLHASQASAQTSAKSSNSTSQKCGAIQSRPVLCIQSILRYAYEGEMYYQQEKFGDAVIRYQKVYDQTKNNSQFIDIHLNAAHRLGVISFENKERDKSSSYFQEIVSFRKCYNNLPNLIDALKGLGGTCYSREDFSNAFGYFTEAYLLKELLMLKNAVPDASKRISRTDPAYYLGRMYKDGQGTSIDRKKAFFFLKESYSLKSTYIHIWAALELGLLYFSWYLSSFRNHRNHKDLEEGRKYLTEAYSGAQSFFPGVCLLIEFQQRMNKIFLIQEGDDLLEKVQEKYNKKLAHEAQRYFDQAKQCIYIPGELNAPLEQEIKEKEQELVKLRAASTQSTFQETAPEMTPQAAAENKKSIDQNEKLVKEILQEIEIKFAAYQKKPSDAREQEVEYLLIEARKFTKNPEIRNFIQQKLIILSKKHVPQQDISSTSINNESKQKQTAQQTHWLLTDPFGEMPEEAKQSPALKRYLDQLKTDYLELPGAIKLHGFIDLWRARAGNVRIIYTVIPQSHSIGIIKIDARRDVYEAPEESRNRETFFQNSTSEKDSRVSKDRKS